MTQANKKFSFQTKELFDFRDITDEIQKFIKETKIKEGIINIQSMHTTGAIIVNENEPLLLQDIKDNLNNCASLEHIYNHDNFDIRTVNVCDDECANGHSHCKALHLPTSVTMSILDSGLNLGTWQRVFFVELDRARPRSYHLHIIGE